SFPGPWLLDGPALDELDRILVEQWKQLLAHKKKSFDNEYEREKRHMQKEDAYKQMDDKGKKDAEKNLKERIESNPVYAEDGCRVILTLKGSGVRVVEGSFSACDNAPECQGQIVTKVEEKIHCGGVKVELVVPTP